MVRIIKKFLVNACVLFSFPCIYSMQKPVSVEQVVPIASWPLYLYAEAFPGAVGNPLESQAYVDALIARACEMTKELADELELSELERVKLDWVYALHQVGKGHLKKPFETFAIDDIRLIASWLTRLTAKHPGVWRVDEVKWPIRAITEEEHHRIDRIDLLRDEDITAEDRALYESCYLLFLSPKNIETEFREFLEDMGPLVARLKGVQRGPAEQLAAILNSAAFIHYTAVRIHAFEEGSKRLGRLLMYIFLAQQGIEPITFYDAQLHGDKLIDVLTGKNKDAFKNYVCESYVLNVKMRRNPFCFAILKELIPQQLSGEQLMVAMLNHPLQKVFESAGEKRSAAVDAQSAASQKSLAKSCEQCGKNSTTIADIKLSICSGCKKAFYCSAACQKAHWPSHKAACKK